MKKGCPEMNWIIKFNQLEKENTDKVLDIIAKFDKYKNDMLDDMYTKAYNLEYSIDKLNVEVLRFNELDEEINKLIEIYKEIKNEFDTVMNKVADYLHGTGREVRQLQYNMIETTSRYITSNKEQGMLDRRIDMFGKKLIKMAHTLEIHHVDESIILKEIREKFEIIFKIAEKKLNKEIEEECELIEQLKEKKQRDYFKIFDYKEMINLAEQNEYKQVRISGDHIIMQHKKSNKIVPIPAHELKYGLMLQIQKQISANKIS